MLHLPLEYVRVWERPRRQFRITKKKPFNQIYQVGFYIKIHTVASDPLGWV